MNWRGWFLSLAMTFGAVGIKVALDTTSTTGFLMSLLTLACSCLFLHVWSLRPAANLTLSGIIQSYLELNVFYWVGRFLLARFNRICQNVETAQTKTLLQFLRAGEKTKFGQDHNMANITSVADFRSRMSLTTYEDYKPYIERCIAGEQKVFFKHEINYFAATSGTTSGKSKFYPTNTKQTMLWILTSLVTSYASMVCAVPKFKQLKYLASVWFPAKLLKTDNGVEMGGVSPKMMRYQAYNCTPREGYNIYNEKTGQYVHMLFALREPEVGIFFTLTSSVLLMLFSLVENQWERFVRDIRRGEIDTDLDIPEDIRKSLNKHLSPSPERADELEAIFRSGCRGMVPRIWPQLVGISTVCTGTFAFQAKVAQDLYVGPDIPIYSFIHISTEAFFGMILYNEGLRDPETGNVRDDYIILPNINFYEFIPAEKTEEEQPEALLAHQVEVGKDYELVVTTFRGLYRFRSGDLIRIVGFRGNTPRYRVLQRVGYILNVETEKLTEEVFCQGIERAAGQWKSGKLVNFAATENVHLDKLTETTNDKLFYVVFLATDSDQRLSEEEMSLVDIELCRVSEIYSCYRKRGTISPPRIIQVHNDSFQTLRNMVSEKNPFLYRPQYKPLRIIRSPDRLTVLINNQL